MKQIKQGESIIDAQLSTGFESASGFRDAFSRILGAPPSKTPDKTLKSSWLDSPLGPMLAVADDDKLYLLEFVDRRGLEREIERLRARLKAAIIPGTSPVFDQIKAELDAYFKGQLDQFRTPLFLLGSDFQKRVWQALTEIPHGQTISYSELAEKIGKPTACRAVANANGANQLAIIIPCHRVINSNGELGGYGGGVAKKQWLLDHEKTQAQMPKIKK